MFEWIGLVWLHVFLARLIHSMKLCRRFYRRSSYININSLKKKKPTHLSLVDFMFFRTNTNIRKHNWLIYCTHSSFTQYYAPQMQYYICLLHLLGLGALTIDFKIFRIFQFFKFNDSPPLSECLLKQFDLASEFNIPCTLHICG